LPLGERHRFIINAQFLRGKEELLFQSAPTALNGNAVFLLQRSEEAADVALGRQVKMIGGFRKGESVAVAEERMEALETAGRIEVHNQRDVEVQNGRTYKGRTGRERGGRVVSGTECGTSIVRSINHKTQP
jgi:hypothetical protein